MQLLENTLRNNCLRFIDLAIAADYLATLIQRFDGAIAGLLVEVRDEFRK